MGLIINKNKAISLVKKLNIEIDNKKETININRFDYINVSNEKHNIKVLKKYIKNNNITLDFSNNETYIIEYIDGMLRSKIEYKKVDALNNFNIDTNMYGIVILDKHNKKIWLPVISNDMVFQYDEILSYTSKRHNENIDTKKVLMGYALFGTEGAILASMNDEDNYDVVITLKNNNKLLIGNLTKETSDEIIELLDTIEE